MSHELWTREINGFVVTARVEDDPDCPAPWINDDGHGPVSGWTARRKSPGEMILSSDRGRSYRYYDFAEACRIAREEWVTPGPKLRQRAAQAAMEDFERLRRWCNDQWHYVGVVLSVYRELDGEVGLIDNYAAALWGIDSDCEDYIAEVAEELIPEAVANIQAALLKVTFSA